MPGCMAAISFMRRMYSFWVRTTGSPFSPRASNCTTKLVFSTLRVPFSKRRERIVRSTGVSSATFRSDLRIRLSTTSESTRTSEVFSSLCSSRPTK